MIMFYYIFLDSLINLPHFTLNFSFSLSLSNDKLEIFVLLFVYFILLGLSHKFFYVFYNFILFDIVLYFLFVSRLSLISTCRLPIAHISVCDTNKKSTYEKIKTKKKKRKMFTN